MIILFQSFLMFLSTLVKLLFKTVKNSGVTRGLNPLIMNPTLYVIVAKFVLQFQTFYHCVRFTHLLIC